MTINVTADDIANGVPGDPCYCPIARAVKRQYGYGCGVSIKRIYLYSGRGQEEYSHTPESQSFLIQFDKTRKGEPFSFKAKKR